MWVLSDDDMRELLGGEFIQVILAKQIDKNMSIRKLFYYQVDYLSYNGFRKFYNKVLYNIIDSIKYIDDDRANDYIFNYNLLKQYNIKIHSLVKRLKK